MPHPRSMLFFTFLAIPWLNPFAPGPSAAMAPWLASLACVGVALWVASVFGSRHCLSRIVVVFFVTTMVYFAAHMLWIGASLEALATLVAWGCILVMVCLGAALAAADRHDAQRQKYVHLLAGLWLTVALISVVMALCQYLRIEQWFAPWISHSGDGTAFANLRQRNQFATLCAMGLFGLLHLLQTVSHATPYARWQSPWPWLAVTALAIGNGLSSSRTGAVQWLLIAAAVWRWRGSLHAGVRRLGYGALGIYAVVVVLMPWFASAVGNASTGLWGRAQGGDIM